MRKGLDCDYGKWNIKLAVYHDGNKCINNNVCRLNGGTGMGLWVKCRLSQGRQGYIFFFK